MKVWRSSDSRPAGRAAGLFAGLAATVAAGGLLGYYVVGPRFEERGGARPERAALPPGFAPGAGGVQRPSAVADPDVKVEISEDANKPSSEPRSVFRVRVGDYSEEPLARQTADALKARGQPAIVTAENSGGARVWRVQAGPFGNRGDADGLAQKLKEQGFSPVVVQDKEQE